MTKKIKCKTCGTMFEPKGSGDRFCSAICRTTGLFVGGGGDTSKPMSEEQRKAIAKKAAKKPTSQKKEPAKRIVNGAERFPRVVRMFELPQDERWELAKTFTEEESEYARRIAKRMLVEDAKIDELVEWDGGSGDQEESASYSGISGGSLGDSDDGSI